MTLEKAPSITKYLLKTFSKRILEAKYNNMRTDDMKQNGRKKTIESGHTLNDNHIYG
jgi:hypothetical protein